MKLTKKLLAILLAASMLVGMVVISTSAVQLDDAVESLTWDDCADINPETNPYTVKMGFKIYKVDTASGEYTLLEDTNSSNDTYDVAAEAGDVLRVETWAQTNFHTIGIQLAPAYSNAWLLPTTMSDYTVVATDASYPLKVAKAADKAAMAEAFPKMVDFCDDYGAGDGTMEAPVFITEALTQAKGQINHNSWSGLRGVLPKDWQGSGTTEAKWINTAAVDQWGNSIVDADGKLIYNVYQMGMGNNATGTEAWVGYGAILNVYQPVAVFNLTVAEGAEGTAKIFYPESSYYNTSNAYTQFTAIDYDAVQASPDANGNWDESMPQVCAEGLTTYPNKVTYSDGTQADKNWIVTNATVTIGGSEGGEDDTTTETTTEAPTEPPVEYADLAALQAAIAAAANADTANCTSASIARFEAALAAANALNVEGTLKSEQDAVDAAAEELVAAQAALTKLGAADYSKLDAAIDTVVDTANCTSDSVAKYEAALAAAKAVERDMIADEAGANQAKIDAAEKALTDAIAGLTKLGAADYSKLDAAISTVVDTTNCTSDSVAKYEAALAAAKAVERDMIADEAGANQAKIDAAEKALTDAIAGLTKLGACNYDDLDAAIAAYDALDKNAWTPASWTASDVDAKYAAAKAIARDLVADEAGANQATIAAAAEALDAAIKALVAVADKADLAAAIAAAPANEDAYTPETWAPFAAALAAANEVNADANATQDAVNNALAALNAAQGELALKADKAALAEAIAAAKALDEANYTPDSWAAAKLADAIAAAEVVNDNANASDADVTAALNALAAAVAALDEKADTADLEAAIATLPAVSEEDADPETWAAYEAALAAAQLVLADANASQDDVDAAEADLLAAIAAVKEKDVVYCDYSDLDDAIAEFEALDAAAYTPNSYAAVKAYYDAAKAIERNLEYTDENQEAIDEATDNLHNAMIRELVKVADKAALKAAIDTVVDTANCTSASIAKYEAALADANAVYADANATQDAVDAAKDALVAAQALEKLPKVDYSDLEAQMDRFEALDAAEWTVESYADAKAAYDAAAALVAEDLYDDEAGENAIRVDEATDALNAAINALKAAVKKDALLAEINKAASIEEDLATDATWADYAAALADAKDVYADDTANQGEVDDAAAALAAANAALALRDLVDYADLDAALALVPELGADEYTAKSWKVYADAKAAAEAIARDLVDNKAGTNQKTVDDAAAALVAAFEGLKVNAAGIKNVEFDNEGVYTAAAMSYDFTVEGGASKIQVIFPDKGTMTFDRRNSRVSIVSYNEAGEVINYADEEPAYEVWTIVLTLPAAEYQVRAKYNYTWDTENYAFAVEYDEYETAAQTFTVNGETAVTVAKGDVLVFEAITDKTATKIQFVFNDGGTSTYSKSYAKDNGDGTLTWTITRTFAKSYDVNLRVKAPTGWMADYQGSVSVTVK